MEEEWYVDRWMQPVSSFQCAGGYRRLVALYGVESNGNNDGASLDYYVVERCGMGACDQVQCGWLKPSLFVGVSATWPAPPCVFGAGRIPQTGWYPFSDVSDVRDSIMILTTAREIYMNLIYLISNQRDVDLQSISTIE